MVDGILCDREGKIISISKDHMQLLKYDDISSIVQKRIFAFFATTTVLDIIQLWPKLKKTPLLKIKTFLRATDNTLFPAELSITAQDVNYLIQITPMLNPTALPYPKLSLLKKIQTWLLIIRANFLLATFVPLLFSIIWSLQYVAINNIQPTLLLALIVGTITCHIAANTFNDYFDWSSGADRDNTEFIMSISGGSRAIEFGIINKQQLFIVALINLLIAAICAFYITTIRGPLIMVLSITGSFIAYFYTAPPVRLAARYGLGEICIFLCFGPIFTTGTVYALTGQLNWHSFFVGVPIGFLITSILLINEYPDLAADDKAKKINLAVVLGPKLLPFVVALLIGACYLTTITGICWHILPNCFFLPIFTVPLAIYEIIHIFNINQSRSCLQHACIYNTKLYVVFGSFFIVAGIICLL